MQYKDHFDIIVVGGGHAGTEAALAASRIGAKTLLLTHNIDTIGQMSCNPAMGGIGKGHLIKEIDALGGVIALATDKSGIHFKKLNSRKGPAVRATRAQVDRILYKQAIREFIDNQSNLIIFQQSVDDLIIKDDKVLGIITNSNIKIFAKIVILTTGTFLNGKIYIGNKFSSSAGRAGDQPAIALAKRLKELPFRIKRLKTGTPPRIDGKTINYSVLSPQPGDSPIPLFSFLSNVEDNLPQTQCFIAHTNEITHKIIKSKLLHSAIYSGIIDGIGPRYCPSIEDKIVKFSDKKSHQIFIEPEGLRVNEVYPNGISTSLPFDIQLEFIRSIHGLEKAQITRLGYAIEYDFFDPRDLKATLETKIVENLFFAGQINGTTGYEEAASQGLIAGLNAALKVSGKPEWYPKRNEAYIGVLIDDLITNGTQEPYRMFTSRAEYRLTLREDNADLRLTDQGYKLGLVNIHRWQSFQTKKNKILEKISYLKQKFIQPGTEIAQKLKTNKNIDITHEYSAFNLLIRPEICYLDLEKEILNEEDSKVCEQVEIHAKYSGYIARQDKEIAKNKVSENIKIPLTLNYRSISGLSKEVIDKLSSHRPENIGQASRISGITPSAISLLLVYLKKYIA